jgi:hypothetical protein
MSCLVAYQSPVVLQAGQFDEKRVNVLLFCWTSADHKGVPGWAVERAGQNRCSCGSADFEDG